MSNVLLQNRSSGRWTMVLTAFLGTAAVLMIQGIIFGLLGTAGLEGILRLQFAFTTANFQSVVAGMDSAVKAGVMTHYRWDFALMVMYSAAGYAILYLLLTPKPRGLNHLAVNRRVSLMFSYRELRRKRYLRLLPIIAGVCDLGENILEIIMIQGIVPYDFLGAPVVLVASILSCGKFAFIIASVVVGIWTVFSRMPHGGQPKA